MFFGKCSEAIAPNLKNKFPLSTIISESECIIYLYEDYVQVNKNIKKQ